MSAVQAIVPSSGYKGESGYIYAEGLQYAIVLTDSDESKRSIFYEIIRILSLLTALSFVVLLALSLFTGGPIHWSVAVVGCLGSIGLAGAVWLSKPILERYETD